MSLFDRVVALPYALEHHSFTPADEIEEDSANRSRLKAAKAIRSLAMKLGRVNAELKAADASSTDVPWPFPASGNWTKGIERAKEGLQIAGDAVAAAKHDLLAGP